MSAREVGLAELLGVEIAQEQMGAGLVGMLGQQLLQLAGGVLEKILLLQRPGIGVAGVLRPRDAASWWYA